MAVRCKSGNAVSVVFREIAVAVHLHLKLFRVSYTDIMQMLPVCSLFLRAFGVAS